MVLETGYRLAQRGHEVHCICIRADANIVAEASKTIRFHEIGGPLSSSIWFWLRFRRSCSKVSRLIDDILLQQDPAVLFPQVFPANWWASWVLRRHRSLPCVWYCQEPSAFIHSSRWINALPSPKNWIAWLMNPYLRCQDLRNCSRFETILVNSQFSKTYTEQIYGYESAKVTTVYLGVNRDQFFHDPTTLRKNWVTTICRLTSFKNVDSIIRAIARLVNAGNRSLQLQIVGDGDCLDSLVTLATKLGITSHVCFHGQASDTKVRELLQHSSVFCLASDEEPFGLVAIEALACGTPVVAINRGGPREIIEGFGCGVLVENSTPEKLAMGISAVIDSKHDFYAMSQAALRRARDFDWDLTTAEIERLLARQITERQSSKRDS